MSDGEVTVRWAAVTESELAAIADAKWRAWPAHVPLRIRDRRDPAVTEAQSFARASGAGSVVRIELEATFASAHSQLDGSPDLATLNRALAVLMTDAEYLGAVSTAEIDHAEQALGLRFPVAWRSYITRSVWFRRGWMATGAYVWLYTPSETVDHVRAWIGGRRDRTGMLVIGGDGASEVLTVDARLVDSSVTLTPNVSVGWIDSIEQAPSLEQFLAAIDTGTFDFTFHAAN